MDELTIGDKKYISSKKAAKLTGYAKDYVGQLCREGRVEARLVGRSWYVLESSIEAHRFTKDEKISPAPPPEAPTSSWEAPSYTPGVYTELPALSQEKPEDDSPRETKEVGASPLDMQSIWKEWFSSHQEEPRVVPEPQKASQEDVYEEAVEDTEEVPIHRVEAFLEEQEPYPYSREVGHAREEVYEYETEGKNGSSMLIVKATSIAVALVALSFALISNGLLDSFQKNNVLPAAITNFLEGRSIYKK